MSLPNTAADILYHALLAEELIAPIGTPDVLVGHVSHCPVDSFPSLTCYDTVGTSEKRTMEGVLVTHYGVQLSLRHVDEPSAVAFQHSVCSFIDAIYRMTVAIDENSYRIQNASRKGEWVSLGMVPETTWRTYTLNLLLTIERE